MESPGKIRTIQNFLGNNYIVKASVGHCYEINPAEDSIDIANNFKTVYSIIKGKKSIVNELKQLSREADTCFIATDPDREGEAIGWHIAHRALDKKANIRRISFQEITKSAVLNALKNPGELNDDLFNAQQARSVLDRLVGYKVSPFLWRYVAKKTSAGRVQSIGLKFIVERQAEIDAFVPEEYWSILGSFITPDKEEFSSNYQPKKKLTNKTDTDTILSLIKKVEKWIAEKVTKTEKKRSPYPVFQTSTLQQACSAIFHWPAKTTMNHAQKLYEKGLITYHRTDSVSISKEAISAVRKLIGDNLGKEYLPKNPIFYRSKKTAQEAHEGIRPAHLEHTLDHVKGLTTDIEYKLYELIFKRFLACQMCNAIFDNTKIEILSDDRKHLFTTTGQILRFDGFLRVWSYSSTTDTILPEVNMGDELDLRFVKSSQHFTKPPTSYNDASLVKTLEEKNIGRPSTYASIIETLKRRKYIEVEKKVFRPTDLGKRVCDFLIKAFPELMNPNYTARIEEQLDDIAQNKKVWQNVVEKFWTELEKYLKASKEVGKKIREDNITDILCPACKEHYLVIRFGRYGKFYGCKGFAKKKCDAMFQIGKDGEPVEVKKKEKKYIKNKTCECGGKLIIRKARKSGNEFGGCEKYPKCKKIYSLDGEIIK